MGGVNKYFCGDGKVARIKTKHLREFYNKEMMIIEVIGLEIILKRKKSLESFSTLKSAYLPLVHINQYLN